MKILLFLILCLTIYADEIKIIYQPAKDWRLILRAGEYIWQDFKPDPQDGFKLKWIDAKCE